MVRACLPRARAPAPAARSHAHHRSRAVPPRTQSLQLVFVAVGAASQAINYGALVRYGEPGWLKSTLTMRCNLVACTTLLLGVAATLVMTALGHECAGVVPLLFASVFGLSIIPALVRRRSRPARSRTETSQHLRAGLRRISNLFLSCAPRPVCATPFSLAFSLRNND